MNCPYCGKEMVLGYIGSGKPIFWNSKKRLRLRRINWISPWGLKETVTGSFIDALCCPSCRKIILHLPDATGLPPAPSDPAP